MFQTTSPISIAPALEHFSILVQKNEHKIKTIRISRYTLQDLCPMKFTKGPHSPSDKIYKECINTNLGRILNAAEKALKDGSVNGECLHILEKHM